MWIKNNHHKHPDCLINLNTVASIDSYNQPLNGNYTEPYHIIFSYPTADESGELAYDRWMFADAKKRETCYDELVRLQQVVTLS